MDETSVQKCQFVILQLFLRENATIFVVNQHFAHISPKNDPLPAYFAQKKIVKIPEIFSQPICMIPNKVRPTKIQYFQSLSPIRSQKLLMVAVFHGLWYIFSEVGGRKKCSKIWKQMSRLWQNSVSWCFILSALIFPFSLTKVCRENEPNHRIWNHVFLAESAALCVVSLFVSIDHVGWCALD